MKALFFNPEITLEIWPRIVEALRIINPVITWASGTNIERYQEGRFAGLIIDRNKLSYGRFKTPKAMAIFLDCDVEDGYEYLGLNQDISDIFSNLNEQEDELGWAQDIIDEPLIAVGDVFYIVDGNVGGSLPMSHRPQNVRYVSYIKEIFTRNREGEKVTMIRTQLCNPHNMTYSRSDYTSESSKCSGYDSEESYPLDYSWALNLIETNYWRRLY
jgi:hypothetical protein